MSTKSYPEPGSYSEWTGSGRIFFNDMTLSTLTTKAGSTHAEEQVFG